MSVQNIVDSTGHITGVHKKDAICFADTSFDSINDLDPDKKLTDLHMFDGASVCRKAQKLLRVVYPMLSCIFEAYHN